MRRETHSSPCAPVSRDVIIKCTGFHLNNELPEVGTISMLCAYICFKNL